MLAMLVLALSSSLPSDADVGARFPGPRGMDGCELTRSGARKVSPPSSDAVKYTSNLSRDGQRLVSNQRMPSTPFLFTVIAGWNWDAVGGRSRSFVTGCGGVQCF